MALKQTELEVATRRERILAAATDVFLRYGHARTTMNDVATEAGISPPALYFVFQRKENIFAAVIERLIESELQKYRRAFPRLRTLDRKLHFCCEQWAGHGYDLTEAHPEARDVFNLGFVPVKQMYGALEAFLADLLREAVVAAKLKATPEDLARVLIFGMRGFKDIAEDGDHMRRLIALQVDVVLSALKGAE